MPWMEKVLLFLVICVTTVLIDDHRDVFPTLPREPERSGGGFQTGLRLQSLILGLALSLVPQNYPSTLRSVWGSRWLLPTHLYCKT